MPKLHAKEHYIDMVECYGRANGVCKVAARIYAQRYPNRRPADDKCIWRAYVRSRPDSNPVPHPPIGLKYERMRPVRDAIRDDVEEIIQQEPTTSTRKIAARVGGKSTTVFRCLKEDLNLNPYHFRKTQVLREYKKIICMI